MIQKRMIAGIDKVGQVFRNPRLEIILLVFLPLALLLRIPNLQSKPIWYDEAFSIFLSRQSLAEVISGTAADTMPPLYYFLMHGWMFLNRQIWFLRTLNVIVSLGIVALVYIATSSWLGKSAGLWAALFTAVSPLQIYHAQELRMYALLTLALLGYIHFFMRLWGEQQSIGDTWTNWLGLILCGITAMYSHNLAIFTMVVPNILLLVRRDWQFQLRLILAQFVIGLAWLPWLGFVPMQIAKIQTAFWTPQPGLLQIVQAIVTFQTNLPVPDWFLTISVFTSLLMMALVFYEVARSARGNKMVYALLLFTLVPPSLLFIMSYLMRPLFVPRAFMLSSLTYYALMGRAVSYARNRGMALILCLLFVLPALVVLPSQYTFESFPRSPFKTAAKDLAISFVDGDMIVHDNKLSYFPMHYYQPQLPQFFLADPQGSHNDTLAPGSQSALGIFPIPDLETTVGNARRVWFVVFERAIEEYVSTGHSDHPQLAWLHKKFSMVGLRTFNDLRVYEFIR